MVELEDARRRILAALKPLPEENVSVAQACGRILAADLVAPIDLPIFDNSAMDGYAVRVADLVRASPETPVELSLAGQVPAGNVLSGNLEPGHCVRVFTGSLLPAEADAVVMQEDTRVDPACPGRVHICETVKPWENVRLRGEDLRRGTVALRAGCRLTATRIGLLAALGVREVRVRRQPVIGLLATGNELLEAGAALVPGKIYESNRITLAPMLARSGAVPRMLASVGDELNATREALREALTMCDAVVTTGGVSVGEFDLVKQAFQELGGSMEFWRVAIKPGKPFVFGSCAGRFLFGLPGNPVSTFVTFLLLVRPALWHWQGAAELEPGCSTATLAEPLINRGSRRHFMRVKVDEQGQVRSVGPQASHLLHALASADGLVDVPADTTLPAGQIVRVIQLGD